MILLINTLSFGDVLLGNISVYHLFDFAYTSVNSLNSYVTNFPELWGIDSVVYVADNV